MDFDYNFYINFYSDLKNMNYNEALKHYNTWGKFENRVGCKKQLLKFQEKTIKIINKEYNNLDDFKLSLHKENLFNILIRTSNRPENFKQCIKSVLDQNYKNYKIYVCYDKLESLSYLNTYKDNDNIEFFSVYSTSKEKYKFNLYCNDLLTKVKKGYVVFLDDDDMFCHDKVLKTLNYCVKKNTLLIWNFFRPDKLIYPRNMKYINLGEIASCSFCSNIENYKNCLWRDKKNGDFYFLKLVLKKNPLNLNFLNKILTKTQFNNKIGNSE